MVQFRPLSAHFGAPPSSPGDSAGAAARLRSSDRGLPDTFERTVATVSRTHQIDEFFVTQWDTTRCAAASAVAMAALSGPSYLEALAVFVVRDLETRIAELWALTDDLDTPSTTQRDAAWRALLLELRRHIHAFPRRMETALVELGYEPARTPGTGIGIPPHLDAAPFVIAGGGRAVAVATPDPLSTKVVLGPTSGDLKGAKWFVRNGVGPEAASRIAVPITRGTVPWYSVVTDESTGVASVVLQTRDLELAGAAQILAVHQLTGDELKLLERMISCLEGELAKARGALAALRVPGPPESQVLQLLADTLLVAQQHSAVGLNSFETTQALRASGLDVATLARPVPWRDLARAVAPGELLLLQGRSHAFTFGRLRDGRAFVYDSEGICGERAGPCLRFVEPGEDAQVDQHYGVFVATHRCRALRALTIGVGAGAGADGAAGVLSGIGVGAGAAHPLTSA